MPRLGPNIADPDPAVKIPAIKRIADAGDMSQVPQLIDALQDPDPAVRFFAAEALQRLTGRRHGFQADAPQEQRDEAVTRWRESLTTEPVEAQ